MDKFSREQIAKFPSHPLDGKESPFLVVTSCQTYLSAVLLIGACAVWLKYGWYTQWIEQESVPAVRILTFSVLISCESCCSPITSVWRGKNELTFSAQDGCEEVITEMLDFFLRRRGPCHDKYIAMVGVAFSGSVLPLRWRWGRVIIWGWTLQGRQGCWRIELHKNANGGSIR